MNGLTSKIPSKLRAQNQGWNVTIFALCPFLRPFFGSIPCQALRSLQKSHFASPLSLLGLWLLSLLWSQGVWYQLEPPEPLSPNQEGLHAPGGLYGAPSLGPPESGCPWELDGPSLAEERSRKSREGHSLFCGLWRGCLSSPRGCPVLLGGGQHLLWDVICPGLVLDGLLPTPKTVSYPQTM